MIKMKKYDILLLGLILLVVILLGVMIYNFTNKSAKCILNPQKYYLTELEKANNVGPGEIYCTCSNGKGAGITITSESTEYFSNNEDITRTSFDFSKIKISNNS